MCTMSLGHVQVDCFILVQVIPHARNYPDAFTCSATDTVATPKHNALLIASAAFETSHPLIKAATWITHNTLSAGWRPAINTDTG